MSENSNVDHRVEWQIDVGTVLIAVAVLAVAYVAHQKGLTGELLGGGA